MSTYSGIFFRGCADAGLSAPMGQLRKRIFVDQCGWDLAIENGFEFDQFDREDTIYCSLLRRGHLIGGFRLLETGDPYLASVVFPQLASERPYPRDAGCFEVSRFGIDRMQGDHTDAVRLYSLMFWFARRQSARALVAICDTTYERFLRGLGVRTARYGPPQTIGFDAFGRPIEVMAGEIRMAIQGGSRFSNLLSACDDMEIDDETSVFGRRRVSA